MPFYATYVNSMKKRQWSGTGKQQLNNATQCGAGLGLLVTTVVLDTDTETRRHCMKKRQWNS